MLERSQITYLRAQAHHLKPVVRIGQHGLTEAVVAELERALTDHELVKIRLAGADRATPSGPGSRFHRERQGPRAWARLRVRDDPAYS